MPPDLTTKQPLLDELGWTATLDRADRTYRVRLVDGDRTVGEVTTDRAGEAELRRVAVRAAIARCDRPDQVIRLAFEVSHDRREVIRRGAVFAGALDGGKLKTARELCWPFVGRLEAVALWAGDVDRFTPRFERNKARTAGGLLAAPAAWLVDRVVTAPHLARGPLRIFGFLATFAVLAFLLTRLIAALRARAIRRRIALLDEAAALRIVLDHVPRRPLPRHAAFVDSLRRHLGKLTA